MPISTLVGTEKWPVVRAKINEVITEVNAWVWSWDMLASTYDPTWWARQVSFACTTQTAITDYTFTGTEARDSGYLVTTASNRTVNLDADLFTTGYEVSICKGTNNANTVTIDAQTGNNINGTQTFVLTQYNEVVTLLKDGLDTWKIKSHYYPIGGVNTWDNAINTTYTTLATTLWTANTWSAVQTFLSGMFGLRNVANTFTSFFTNTNTASRTYTLKDANGTIAFTSDITGTNSGTNTGDETTWRINTLYWTSNDFTAWSIELGHATDTTLSRSAAGVLAVEWVVVPTISSTSTLTNKRVTSRIGTEASSATSTPTADSVDQWNITALAAADAIAAPTGTPTDWQALILRIKDNGTARALTWNAIYRASTDLALPSTTVISKTMYCEFLYNSADSKWDFVWFLNNF